MRNYIQIEKTEDGLFLSEGKGTPTDADYDETEHWHPWEGFATEDDLFERIRELLNK